ncbi:NUDIX hydrolase [Methylovirgula sp. 4M-Z18]|uniref:NUDIX hydrolase n=1 Tax=Methylovirgula sp. 4M-Z18 TaxID=2293567 RepID=UPI000E2F1D9E|nr:NUDIX hydrolase [Methylovirgula sp. 4M-Z18]RFB75576.1 NUDIX hydrolase [Methylovirgula sp. 4M-Z18]
MSKNEKSTHGWRVESRRVIHADRWMNLHAERIVSPNGAVIDPYYLLHYPEWVHVVALTPERQMLLVRQYRHGTKRMSLELPGGMMDAADKDAEAAARRELLEETGYTADVFHSICVLDPNPAIQNNGLHIFYAPEARLVAEQNLDHGEELQVEFVPVAEVMAGLPDGLITQSMHVAGIYLAMAKMGLLGFRDE